MDRGEHGLEEGLQGQGLDLNDHMTDCHSKKFLNHSLVYFHYSQHCLKSPETAT